jgi:hypothetical protein
LSLPGPAVVATTTVTPAATIVNPAATTVTPAIVPTAVETRPATFTTNHGNEDNSRPRNNAPTTQRHNGWTAPAGNSVPRRGGLSTQGSRRSVPYPQTPTRSRQQTPTTLPRPSATPRSVTPSNEGHRLPSSLVSPQGRRARFQNIERGIMERELINLGVVEVQGDSVVMRQPPPYVPPTTPTTPSSPPFNLNITNNVVSSSSTRRVVDVTLPEVLDETLRGLSVPRIAFVEVERCLQCHPGYSRDQWESVLIDCGISNHAIHLIVDLMDDAISN